MSDKGIDMDSLRKMRSLIFSIKTSLSYYYEGEIDKSETFDAICDELEKLLELNEKVLIEEKENENE